jgi:ribosomal protein L37AE/L43A
MTYLRCPDCGKKGVTYRMNRHDDVWMCRYCEWHAYGQGEDRCDRDNRRRLANANPDRDIWVTALPEDR